MSDAEKCFVRNLNFEEGEMKKLCRFFGAFMALVVLMAGVGCSPQESVEKPEHRGLYTAEDGTILYEGAPFYGFGVNYYSLLNCAFTQKWNIGNSLSAMETLAEYDVKVIRFNLTGFASSDWDYIIKKEDRYFEVLDQLVTKAEGLGIGLIPSFFWASRGLTDYFDEPQSAAYAAENSKSMQFILEFTEKIVQRYAESSGIWGWEFSNEVNLGMDYPDEYWNSNKPALPANSQRAERTEDDRLKSDDYVHALRLWAEVVEKNDPYGRIIGNGDASARAYAYNWKYNNGSYTEDTLEQHQQMLDLTNPDPVSVVSFHGYAVNSVATVNNPENLSEYMGTDNWDEYIQYLVAQGKRMKKAAYLGETGYLYSDATLNNVQNGFTAEKIVSVYQTIATAAIKNDLQLTLFWNYDDRPDYNPQDPTDKSSGTEWSWNERWDKGRGILEVIRESNRILEEKHKQTN